MKRCVLLVAVVLVGMLSAPLHAKDPDVVGVYRCEGINPDGKPYTAFATIRKQGEVFHLHWAFSGDSDGDNYGVGIIEGGKLSVSVFSTVTIGQQQMPVATGVAVYSVTKGSQLTLKARWTYIHPDVSTIHEETLTKLPQGHPQPTEQPKPKKPPAGQTTA